MASREENIRSWIVQLESKKKEVKRRLSSLKWQINKYYKLYTEELEKKNGKKKINEG